MRYKLLRTSSSKSQPVNAETTRALQPAVELTEKHELVLAPFSASHQHLAIRAMDSRCLFDFAVFAPEVIALHF